MGLEEAGFAPGIVEERAVFARRIAAFPEGFLLAGSPPWGYLCAELWAGFEPADRHRFDLGHDIGAYLDKTGDTLYIASMTVAPGLRGIGRGRNLFQAGVDHLTARFPTVRQTVLIVNEHWAGARRLYEAEGFQEVTRFSGFFHETQGPEGAALVMKRERGCR